MKNDQEEHPSSRLWELELKLRGLGFLIEQQDPNSTLPISNEMAAINKGIGMLINGIAHEMADLCSLFRDVEPNPPKDSKKSCLSVIQPEQ